MALHGVKARGLPGLPGSGKLTAALPTPGPSVRPVLRLLPLPFAIALCLPAHARDDMPPNWTLCPVGDVVPAFAGAEDTPEGLHVDNSNLPTDLSVTNAGDTTCS